MATTVHQISPYGANFGFSAVPTERDESKLGSQSFHGAHVAKKFSKNTFLNRVRDVLWSGSLGP